MCVFSQDVKEGMLMLGCVKEVTDFEVTVSLPSGLQGFLSIKNICDSYTKLLSEQLDSADTEVGLYSNEQNGVGDLNCLGVEDISACECATV